MGLTSNFGKETGDGPRRSRRKLPDRAPSRQPAAPGGAGLTSRAIRRALALQARGGICMVRLDDKLARIRAGAYRRSDFIIADAKDPDMGPGLHAVGPARARRRRDAAVRTRAEFLDSIEAIVKQDVVDIMLTSASNLEQLASATPSPARASNPRSAPTTRPTSGAIAAGLFITRRRGRSAPPRSRTSSRSPTSASIRSPSPTTSTPTSPRSRRSRSFAPTPPPTASPISSKSSIRMSSAA